MTESSLMTKMRGSFAASTFYPLLTMNEDQNIHSAQLQRKEKLRSSNLARTIFRADMPEAVLRELPAQTLFMAVKQSGVSSSVEMIEMATTDQIRLLLDFDCWTGDQFNEESLFEWLALTDATSELALLQKILKSCDLKIITLLISRHVEAKASEEATDMPPGEGFYTPDKGWTWIRVKTEDSEKHFLLMRLLALLFETNADLFYQILAIPNYNTESTVMEEAYQDRERRLSGEGIPDAEFAARVHLPRAAQAQVQEQRERLRQRPTVQDIAIVEPVIYDTSLPTLLSELARELNASEEFEGELTLLANAAVVRYAVDFSEFDEVQEVISFVKGTINLGLEALIEASGKEGGGVRDIYDAFGLQGAYAAGLFELTSLRRAALEITEEVLRGISSDRKVFSAVAGCREIRPVMADGEQEEGAPLRYRAFMTLSEVRALARQIADLK